ncbi:MAG: helicase-exonuclease AddAB subunit AddA, partial [Lysinibacillus sp.]
MIPTKPSNVTWTDDQWKAIYAKGHDILVAAAAGSGKTAVLIERLIQKILAPKDERIDVDALLVVTFTNAAAAEMRSRMAAALEKAVENSTDPEQTQFLRRQLSLIGKAQISTLHSFCLTVCRQYAYMIDLDPGFRIASQDEVALLKDDVLAQVLEQAYKGEAENLPLEDVYTLVDSFTSDRNDTQIEGLIERLYEMARVQPKPYEWLAKLPNEYDLAPEITIDELSFIDDLKLAIEHQLLEAKYHYEEMKKLSIEEYGLAAYAPVAEEEGAYIDAALNRIQQGTWQETADLVKEISFGRIPTIRKGTCDDVAKDIAKGHRDKAKDIVESIKTTYFTRDAVYLVEEIRKMQPIIESLVKLTVQFSEAFKKAKLERSIIDFSDLEHYALEILTVPDEKDIVPSPVALDYRERFAEVLVDEYQDVNLLQETILQLVKKGDTANGNMFMVGDVKQSIYQFRLAEPRLFLQKYKDFTSDANGTGMKIDLNRNFRSRSEVLDSTNYVFEQVMDEGVGEINYDDKASLKYGEGYNEDRRTLETELVIFDEKGKESFDDETDSEALEKSQREARYIIKRIKAMVGQEMVYDAKTKSYREMRYSDIVILMRSMRWASDLAEEFKREKIPLYADSSKGYFEAIEVMIMMNLLKVIDNPFQDIPLASVLRAPFVGLTENELAEIRLANPRASFYEAMQS